MRRLTATLSDRLERWHAVLAGLIYRRAGWTLLAVLALAVLAVLEARTIRSDGSIEGFLRPEDPALASYEQFRHQFGQDGEIVVAVEPPEIFNAAFLHRLVEFHRALARRVPHVEDITSLLNARDTLGGKGLFVVEDLLDDWPSTPAAMAAFRQRVMGNPIYRDLLISADGKLTTITIKPDRYGPAAGIVPGAERTTLDAFALDDAEVAAERRFLSPPELARMVAAVQAVAAEYQAPDFKISIAGAPVAASAIVKLLSADMPRYTLFCLATISLLLIAFTRRASYVFLSLIVTALTLVSTFALMAATGTAIKPPTQVLLSIVIVGSVFNVLHLLSLFFRRLDVGADKATAVVDAVRHCAVPILFANLTTVAGLLSFNASELAPINDLGRFGAIAVMLSSLYALILVPAALRFLRVRPRPVPAGEGEHLAMTRLDRALVAVSGAASRRPLPVLAAVAILILVLGSGLFSLRFAHNSLLWLPEDHPARVDTLNIDAKLRGAINLEVVADTHRQDGARDHDLLLGLDELTRTVPRLGDGEVQVGKALAVSDLLKEINQALHEENPAFHRVPEPELVDKAFLLFENSSSDDLPDFVDSLYTKTRFTVRVPWLEASLYSAFIDRVQAAFERRLGPGVEVSVTGLMALLAKTSASVIRSMAESYLLSTVSITALMVLVLGSWRLGLLSTVPNFLPIFLVLGFMGHAGLPLDTFSILIGSILLGLLVDDTIHFLHHFRRQLDRTEDVQAAVAGTAAVTGQPILLSAFVLAVGFGSYMLASMHNVAAFGLVMGLGILLGLLSELCLSPALVALAHRRRGAALPAVLPNTTTA